MAALLEIEDFSLAFRTEDGLAHALDRISIRVDENEIMGFVGESGSGKSVTALSILGLLPADRVVRSGRILYRGTDLLRLGRRAFERLRGRSISMIFQSPGNSLNPLLRVGDQLEEIIRLHRGMGAAEIRREAEALLERVELPSWVLRSYPHELSGGMQQRASIAIAISCHPDLLIADEPTSSLDVSIQAQIIDLLRSLHLDNAIRAIIFITHDFGLVDALCDKVTVLYAGQIAESGIAHDVLRRPRHPYTRGLLAAVPRLDSDGLDIEPIGGTVPGLLDPPLGCRFHPRCRIAVPACARAYPPVTAIDDTHRVHCHLVHAAATPAGHG